MRRNLLLAAATVVVFFGLIEVALRLSGRVPTDQLRSPDLKTLDSIPGMFDPGQDLIDRLLPDLPYRVRINQLGFRGADIPLGKPHGTLRVLCVGDSYTFGPHVEDDQTFPVALGRELEAIGPPGHPPIEVINAGVSGFSILDETTLVREKAYRLEPDIVVLVFCQNDVEDLARKEPMIESMRDHARLKSRLVLGPILKFLQHTAVFNGMQRVAAMIRVHEMRAEATGDTATPELWSRYRELLGQFVRLVRERQAKPLMVVWISAKQLDGSVPLTPQAKLAGFARELDLPLVDLEAPIRELAATGANPYFVPLDGHPNALAYQAAARATARKMVDLGYIAPASSVAGLPARP